MKNKFLLSRRGFSAIELLVYIAIFTVSAVFLVAILTAVTRVQTRQLSSREVDQALAFVNRTIEDAIKKSSLIDIPAGVPSSVLVLRTNTAATDPTRVYASGTTLYLTEGSDTYTLTDSSVSLENFSVTKYDHPGTTSVVEVSVGLGYNSLKAGGALSRSLKSAISRVSAAEFDSSVHPASDNTLDLGIASKKWRDGYFSGNLDIFGRVGVGVSPSASARIKSGGDIGFSASGMGMILMAPNGTCYRVTITNLGALTTASVACP